MNEMRDPKHPAYQDEQHTRWDDSTIFSEAERMKVSPNQVCCICLRIIHMQIMKNSGVCSEQCRKDRDNDHEPFKAVGLRIHEGEDV